MKKAMQESAPFQHEGIMSISKTLSGNVDTKVKRWVESAKRQGQDIDKMSEQEIKYIVELNKPKPPKVISADSPQGKVFTQGLADMLNKASGKNVIKTDFGGGITDDVSEIIIKIKTMEPMDAMKEANKVLKGEGRYKSLSKADREKIVNDESVTDHIFERNVDVDPEDFAQGGRTGFQEAGNVETDNSTYPTSGKFLDPKLDEKKKADILSDPMFTDFNPNSSISGGNYLDDEDQSGFAPGRVLSALGKLAALGIIGPAGLITDPKTIATNVGKQIVGKKVIKPIVTKGLQQIHGGGGGGTSIGGGQQTSKGIAGGQVSHAAAKEARGGMSGWGLAQGGRPGTGLNYLLGEDDQNSRMPYGGGGTGKPPITFNLTGGGSYGKNKIGPGLDLAQSGYGFNLGANLDLPWGLSLQGGVGIGRGKTEVDYNDQNVFTGVDETKLGDRWNLGLKWSKKFNEGGRTAFGIGGLTRRAFLKMMGAGAAGVGAANSGLFSLLKSGKPAIVKDLTSVPIKTGVDGMPLWFKPLVNKVIKEGEDVTKKFATQERQIVHKTELPDSKTDVVVTQDLTTGDVVVDIGLEKHGFADGKFGQPTRLEYKASEIIEPDLKTGKGGGKSKEEFWVEEAEFTGGHPENIKFEESVSSKFGKHESDFSEVEAFAKGKTKKTRKISSLQKQGEDLADRFSNYPTPDDFASGGRVPLAKAGRPKGRKVYGFKQTSDLIDTSWDDLDADEWLHIIKLLRAGEFGAAEGGRVPFIFGGGAIKNVFKRLKDMRKMPHTEKMMKSNPKIQHLLTKADKLELEELKVEHAQAMLDMLKADRDLFLQFQSNKAMKDEGLDFLMKKVLEPMAPHIKQYKSLKEIDEAILNMEMIVKNKAMKQGRQLNATGGRVPLAGGTRSREEWLKILKEDLKREFDKQRDPFPKSGDKEFKDFELKLEQIFSKDRLKSASGGLAGMLGE